VCLDCYLRIHSADLIITKKQTKVGKPISGEGDVFACFGVDLK
jgi:hypothetical protein